MAAKLERTRTPGIFKRGSRYVFSYRVAGRQHWESYRTLDEARRAKAARQTDIGRGEFEARSRITLHEYAREWIDRYQGRGRRGFRESTREDYRRVLDQYVLEYFPARMKLTDVTPGAVAGYVAWLCERTRPAPTKDDAQRRLPLADKSIRNYMGPLSACMASAVREGLIRHNPTRDVDLPHRPTADDVEHEDVRALTTGELATLLAVIPERHRLFFRLLAATGLRISEAIALQWRHVHLDGSSPHIKVRRGVVRGVLGPPKSAYSRREVPIDHQLVRDLRKRRADTEWPGDEDLVFPDTAGGYLHVGNLRRRVLVPARQEANVPWAGFHTFRHTCASLLFRQGRNAVQVQHWLGHHSAAFTLATYVHLLDGDLGEPLALPSANGVLTDPTPSGDIPEVLAA
jgi:integrase